MGPLGDSNTVTLQMDWLLKWCAMAYCCARRSEHLTRFIREGNRQRPTTGQCKKSERWWRAQSQMGGRCRAPPYEVQACTPILGCTDPESRRWSVTSRKEYFPYATEQLYTQTWQRAQDFCMLQHNPTTSWRAISFWQRKGELPLVTWLLVGDPHSKADLSPKIVEQHKLNSVWTGDGEKPQKLSE